MSTAKGIASNRTLWDVWTEGHENSGFYDVEAFRAGKNVLTDIEVDGVGDVQGKTLLHLQCHFGQDTLEWARRGAIVTGVDFSQKAIGLARELAKQMDIPATFVCSELDEIKELAGQEFDIIFTSYGVLSWLPDLDVWARTIARHLKPGGMFYIAEFHPAMGMFDDDGEEVTYSYFGEPEPIVTTETVSYGGAEHAPVECYQWGHSLSDVIGSLLRAGLTLERFKEFDYSPHQCYEFFVEQAPGRYVMQRYPGKVPLVFEVVARR